jgi:outer membrane protein assembly factor BamB
LGTFAVGTDPQGIAFDGANMWVANQKSNNITKLRVSDGAVLGTYTTASQSSNVVFDGTYIWVSCTGSVVKLNAANGALIAKYSAGGPYGVAFDGADVWVSNENLGTVSKL